MTNGLTEQEKRETMQVAVWLTGASFAYMAIVLAGAAIVLSDDRLNSDNRLMIVSMTAATLIVFAVILCYRLWRLLRYKFK